MNWFILSSLSFSLLILLLTTSHTTSLHIHHVSSMNASTDSALFVKQSASAGFMTSMLRNFQNLTYNVSNTNNENFLVIQKTEEAIERIKFVDDVSILLGPSFTEPATTAIETLRANNYMNTSAFILMTGEAVLDLETTYSALSTIDLRTQLIVQMLAAFGWRYIDVLYLNNQFGVDYYNSLLRSIGTRDIDVLSSTFQTQEDLEISLRSMELSKRRIVVLVTGIQFASASLDIIDSLDIFNDEYIWFVDGVFEYNLSQLPLNWFQFSPTTYTNQSKYDEIETAYTLFSSETSTMFPFASAGLISQTLWGYTLGEYLTAFLRGDNVSTFDSVFGIIQESFGYLNTGHIITQPRRNTSIFFAPEEITKDNLTFKIVQNFYVENNLSFAFVRDSCGTAFQYRDDSGVCMPCAPDTYNFAGDAKEECFPCSSGDTVSADGKTCVTLDDGSGLSDTEIIVVLLSTLVPLTLFIVGYIVYKRYRLLRVENEIIKSNYDDQNRFVDFLCHEIRNPMNIVYSYLRFTIESLIDPEEDFEPEQILTELKKCIFSCEHAIDILNNVLSVSKIKKNDVIIKLETFDLLDTIGHVLRMLDHIKNDNVSVKTIVNGNMVHLENVRDPIMVQADQRMIKQVMLNLIINAFKFTTNGYVEVSVSENKEMGTVITVSDTGVGLSSDAYKYVMNPDQNTYKGKGNGIGLYVVHEYLKCMNSKLFVQSPLPSGLQGSMFQFSLKISDSNQKYDNQTELKIEAMKPSRSNSSFSQNESPKDIRIEMKQITRPLKSETAELETDDLSVNVVDEHKKSTKKLKVLVVDDSSLNVKIIIRSLKKFLKKEFMQECNFTKGYSLKDIRARVMNQENFDFVVFDQNLQSNKTVTMAGLNNEDIVIHTGSEMIHYMKTLPVYQNLVCIIYSGSVQEADLTLYKSHGVDFVINKPLQITDKFKSFFSNLIH